MARLIEPDPRDKKLFDATTMFAVQFAEAEEKYETDIDIDFRRISRELSDVADATFVVNTTAYVNQLTNLYGRELAILGRNVVESYQPLSIDAKNNYTDLLNNKPLLEQFEGLFDFLFAAEEDEDDEEEEDNIIGLSDNEMIALLSFLLIGNQTIEAQTQSFVQRQRLFFAERLNQAVADSLTGDPDAFETTDTRIRRETSRTIRETLVSRQRGIRTSASTTKRLVSTQLNRIKNSIITQTVEKNPQLFAGEMWSAILDTRTCIRCANLDGKVFRLKNGESTAPPIPLHLDCRCTLIPVRVGSKLLGGRAEIQTFPSWLKGQSSSVQDRVLGDKKGQLFRSGKFGLDDFVTIRRRTPIKIKRNDNIA